MTITMPWHELVSWTTTLVSLTLLIAEVRKNDNTKYYMVLQGILRACSQRAGFVVHVVEDLKRSERQIPREEFVLAMESEYINYVSLQEHIMGSMKSLQPKTDTPFDVGGFVNSGRVPPAAPAAR